MFDPIALAILCGLAFMAFAGAVICGVAGVFRSMGGVISAYDLHLDNGDDY